MNWPTATLGDVSYSIVDGPFGSSLKASDYVDEGVPVLQGKNITGNSFVWKEVRYISHTKAQELKRSSVVVGDHLIIKIGSIGYSAIIDQLDGHEFAIIPANLARIRPDRRIVDDRFLHHWLKSEPTRLHFQSVASKTAQPALSLSKIRNAILPLPPLDEQRRIAAILDKADALRRKRKRALELLDGLTQSIFLEMFGQAGAEKEIPLSELVDPTDRINYGVVQPGDDDEKGVPLVRVSDLENGRISHSHLRRISSSTNNKHRRSILKGGEILLSCVGSIGEVATATEQDVGLNIARAITRIPLRPEISRAYVAQYLRSDRVQRYFERELRTVSQPTLNIKQIAQTPIFLPPPSEQREFENRLAKVEHSLTSARASYFAGNALFASLQSRAFSGQL